MFNELNVRARLLAISRSASGCKLYDNHLSGFVGGLRSSSASLLVHSFIVHDREVEWSVDLAVSAICLYTYPCNYIFLRGKSEIIKPRIATKFVTNKASWSGIDFESRRLEVQVTLTASLCP